MPTNDAADTSGNDRNDATASVAGKDREFDSNLQQHQEENGDAAEAF